MKAGAIKIGWALGVTLMLAGCQTTSPVSKSAALDNTSFMGMWTTYRHCEAASDLDTMRLDAHLLGQVAQQPVIGMGHDALLPKVVKRWVSEPANRLAVDPKAMAVACSLHTGQSAFSAGHYELADEMFHAVLTYPEGIYPYYVQQAREGLAQLNTVEANASDKPALPSSFIRLLASTASGN